MIRVCRIILERLGLVHGFESRSVDKCGASLGERYTLPDLRFASPNDKASRSRELIALCQHALDVDSVYHEDLSC
jgi:hypothetical protein